MRCDVCKRQTESPNVHASGIGPFSFAYCSECDAHNAEPIETFLNLIKLEKEENLIVPEAFKDFRSYLPGQGYVGYAEIEAFYARTK
jgi:hypothetical protein